MKIPMGMITAAIAFAVSAPVLCDARTADADGSRNPRAKQAEEQVSSGRDFQKEMLDRFERQYILVVPKDGNVEFFWDGEINLFGIMGQQTFVKRAGEEFDPFGPDHHAHTVARIEKINRDSVELLVTDTFDARSFGDGISRRSGKVVLPFSPRWKAAVYNNDTAVFVDCLKTGDINARDGFGRTPLMIAGFYGHEEIVRLLLEKGADVAATQEDGYTALTLSLAHPGIVEMLLKAGAPVRAQELFMAAMQGHARAMKLFLDNGADINVKDEYGNSLFAIAGKYPEIVRLLQAKGKTIGLEELLALIKGDNVESFRRYLDEGGKVDLCTPDGKTLLMHSVRSQAIFSLLVRRGADINARDHEGLTALDWAMIDHEVRSRMNQVELLLAHNAVVDANTRERLEGREPGNDPQGFRAYQLKDYMSLKQRRTEAREAFDKGDFLKAWLIDDDFAQAHYRYGIMYLRKAGKCAHGREHVEKARSLGFVIEPEVEQMLLSCQ